MPKVKYIPILPVIMIFIITSSFAKEEFVIKYGHVALNDPFKQSSPAYALVFKTQLEKLSGGRIRVDIYPNGQLGNLRSLVQQVRKGTIQIADISSGIMASLYYPQLEILDTPYLFSSRATARMALDNDNPFIRNLIDDCTNKTGVRILSLAPFGFRHMTNSVRPIKTPDDMKGMKIRTMEIVPHMKLMESFGANAVPIPWTELYSSLQTKVVDGEETTLQNIVMGNLHEVQKYLTLTQHLMGVGAFICNEKWYQSLPDDLKKSFTEAEKTARLTYDGVGELLDTLAIQTLQEKQMEIYRPTPEQLKAFKTKAFPEIKKYMEKKYGSKFVSEFLSTVQKAQEKLTKETKSTITSQKNKKK